MNASERHLESGTMNQEPPVKAKGLQSHRIEERIPLSQDRGKDSSPTASRIGWFDCSSGVAGNMILGCLFDAGMKAGEWYRRMSQLPLPVTFSFGKVRRQGITAILFHATPPADSPARGLKEIVGMIRKARLDRNVTERSIAIFERLGRAEARVHGTTIDKVHFHEVGGYDCIVDIVGSVLGLSLLGVERLFASAVNVGQGTVTFSHGTFPVPPPAVAELLKGMPVYQPECETGELATPTGAAILAELVEDYGPMPPMRVLKIGYGAGDRETPAANTLRLFVGERLLSSPQSAASVGTEQVVVIETNIDDMNPELLGYVMDQLLAKGALDVFFTPIYMKKNRPATLLSVIAPPERFAPLVRLILTETTSLGVRYREMNRVCLEREIVEVKTPLGPIQMKLGKLDGYAVTVAPEYESCRKVARKLGLPLKRVYEEALRCYMRR